MRYLLNLFFAIEGAKTEVFCCLRCILVLRAYLERVDSERLLENFGVLTLEMF